LAKKLLADSGFSVSKPVQIKLATTNGQFPGDYDMARAIAQMWKKVGIDAEIEVIEYSKYFELNRGNKLPEATLYSWDNAPASPRFLPLPTTTSGSLATKRSTRRRWSTGPSCRSCKA
jgi:peptide/nickel transport system substrate-binding protein